MGEARGPPSRLKSNSAHRGLYGSTRGCIQVYVHGSRQGLNMGARTRYGLDTRARCIRTEYGLATGSRIWD